MQTRIESAIRRHMQCLSGETEVHISDLLAIVRWMLPGVELSEESILEIVHQLYCTSKYELPVKLVVDS